MTSDAGHTLDPRLAADTFAVVTLTLCDVRLMDDARYPWLVLVPRRVGAVEVLDLGDTDRTALWVEVEHCARVLRDLHRPDKLNVAALGNVVAQLHVHVIARFEGDDAWPRPVWGVHPPRRYPPADAAGRLSALAHALGSE